MAGKKISDFRFENLEPKTLHPKPRKKCKSIIYLKKIVFSITFWDK